MRSRRILGCNSIVWIHEQDMPTGDFLCKETSEESGSTTEDKDVLLLISASPSENSDVVVVDHTC